MRKTKRRGNESVSLRLARVARGMRRAIRALLREGKP